MMALRRSQQLAGFLASPVAAGSTFRAMLIDLLRLTGRQAEQFPEIHYKTTPDLSRESQPIKQPSKLLRRRKKEHSTFVIEAECPRSAILGFSLFL
jgi:hypothetical protein